MSTAEAVSVFYQTMSSAYYYGDGKTDLKELTQNLLGAVCKENKDDLEKLKSYFRIAVKEKVQVREAYGQNIWIQPSI